MRGTKPVLPAVLMLGYTYYESDSRVIREAEAAVAAEFDVDFLAEGRIPQNGDHSRRTSGQVGAGEISWRWASKVSLGIRRILHPLSLEDERAFFKEALPGDSCQ